MHGPPSYPPYGNYPQSGPYPGQQNMQYNLGPQSSQYGYGQYGRGPPRTAQFERSNQGPPIQMPPRGYDQSGGAPMYEYSGGYHPSASEQPGVSSDNAGRPQTAYGY